MVLSRRLVVLLGTGTDDQHWMAQLCQRPHLQGPAGVRSMLRAPVLRCKLRHFDAHLGLRIHAVAAESGS